MDGGDKGAVVAMAGFEEVSAALLAWYDREARDLPWRSKGSASPDPYRVWLSEIMLQQTTVKAAGPYYLKFLELWPDVTALARADRDEVMRAWAGLGYYSRARNMHRAARIVADEMGGRFPKTAQALEALPGVGPYTAAAVASIAFGEPAAVVDGNIERVLVRQFGLEEPVKSLKRKLRALACELTPAERPGDYAQAMMDLGAMICTPRQPACRACPISASCQAHARGIAAHLPLRAVKADKPQRLGTAFFALRADGAVLLRRRPEKGLLGAMMEVPSEGWSSRAGPSSMAPGIEAAPFAGDWRLLPGRVHHSFHPL